jgi:hypothetical protein
MVALLDRGEESVQVDMQDRPFGHGRYHPPSVQPPSDDRSPIEPLDSTALIVVMLATAGVLVATWNLPILAAIFAWPFLFFVLGWVLVRRIAPDLPRPGSVGVAVVTSVVLSTHLVGVVGHVADVGRAAVLLTTVGLAVATVVFARLRHPWLAPLMLPSPRAFPGELRRALREDAAAWIVAGLVAFVVLDILWVNGWRETPDGFVSGGWNWSDLLVHVAIGNSIIHGNFPPEVPYFAGEPLSYHWFADFHGAIAATAADLPIIPVFFVSSALMAGVLALVVWALAWSISWRRDVALIATVLVCVTGGMGWLRLVGDALGGTASISELVVQNPYDNSWADTWPFFRIASIFGTGFLPHRATTFGLPGLVAVVLLVVTCWGRRPGGVLLAGILAALLAPFHFYAFPATYLIVGLYVLATDRWRDPALPRDALLFLTPIVLAMPYVLPAALRQGAEGSFRFVLGWGEARVADGPAAVAFFYLTNRRAVPRAEPRGRQRGRVRYEQVLPDDVDPRGDRRRLAPRPLAPTDRDRGRRGERHLTGADRRPPRDAPGDRDDGGPGGGGPLDRDEHPRPRDLRDRRLHQQPGRPRRSAADHDLRAVCLEPRLRPRAAQCRHRRHLLRGTRGRRQAHGEVPRHLRAVLRRGAGLRRAHRLRLEPALRDRLRGQRGQRVAPRRRLTSGPVIPSARRRP